MEHSTINQDTGTVIYTPDPGFAGTDSFRFKVNNGKVDSSNTGTVNITVGASLSEAWLVLELRSCYHHGGVIVCMH